MRSIAFIDFDGNIYKGDSMLHFIRYVHGKRFLYTRLILCIPQILGYKLKLLNSRVAKEKLIKLAFKGQSYENLHDKRLAFSEQIDQKIFRKAQIELKRLESLNTKIVIVSASTDLWLEPWCKNQNYELVASRLSLSGGKITGRLDGENCRGQEKVRRIKLVYDLSKYQNIFAYGNESSDKPMIKLGNQPHLCLFK